MDNRTYSKPLAFCMVNSHVTLSAMSEVFECLLSCMSNITCCDNSFWVCAFLCLFLLILPSTFSGNGLSTSHMNRERERREGGRNVRCLSAAFFHLLIPPPSKLKRCLLGHDWEEIFPPPFQTSNGLLSLTLIRAKWLYSNCYCWVCTYLY